ncbi:DNA/RNA non-specific endonuclease [uncultured Eudoraea sp.]|uniref:DNA/RNA non-specific endonuclease n=1 Tax=uncultured Eudoraea sp. TaxID=1035614 RepID=UPI0026132E38|nr:DNA/RNA non-specific endonuclease [uncultured Eudoraea sp.]
MVKRSSRKRNRTIYATLMILCIIGFWVFENFYTPDLYSDPTAKNSTSLVPAELLPVSNSGEIVIHSNFMLSYMEPYEQAEWVAYALDQSHLTYDNRERPYYIEDPKVSTKSADWRNYKASGYDRGHLCPAGDRRFSIYAYNETFYTSNITPQKNEFNSGIWNELEKKIRSWCRQYKNKNLYVITGGVLEKGLPTIGEEDVAVPKKFYKIVVKKEGAEIDVLAFLIPHKETREPLINFLVTVDDLEEISGIDFFSEMPEEEESRLEGKIVTMPWSF